MNSASSVPVQDAEFGVNKAARILVVEDERIVARSLRNQLNKLGYEVVGSVASGQEAVQQAEESRPELVLMDIYLEGPMDGVEAAARIRSQFRLPVVYLTAYSNKETLERAKVTEPFGYILKPYEERELHVVIETALYRHRMERRQQDREGWFVATLKSICDGVIATDVDGCITYMNPLAEALTGWMRPDALGQPWTEVLRLVHENSRRPLQSLPERHLSDDLVLIARDCSEKSVEKCVSAITDEQGSALGKVVVFRDVSWRKRLEKKLVQANSMATVGQLAGGVAHALNNLMTAVIGHSELMLDGMTSDNPLFTNSQEIKRSAIRTAALTQKLLAVGRKQTLTMRAVDLNAVIGGLAYVIQHLQSDIQVTLSLEPGLGVTMADRDQLEEAILTLVRNACDAMPDGGRLDIQTANVELGQDYTLEHPEVKPGLYLLLAVSDDGVGMDHNAISHLFEPFNTKKAGIGAGLGLAATYGFIKQCGGDIAVQSTPLKGTTFRMYLPVRAPDSEAATPTA